MPSIHNAGADAHEKDSIRGILGVELAYGHVHTCLADGVRGADFEAVLVDHLMIGHTGADGNDFLDIPLEYQRQE